MRLNERDHMISPFNRATPSDYLHKIFPRFKLVRVSAIDDPLENTVSHEYTRPKVLQRAATEDLFRLVLTESVQCFFQGNIVRSLLIIFRYSSSSGLSFW